MRQMVLRVALTGKERARLHRLQDNAGRDICRK